MPKLHPKMVARAQMVKESHAHLSKHVPGFRQQSPKEQIAQTQAHVHKRLAQAKQRGGY